LVATVVTCGWQEARGAQTKVDYLRCEGLENPQGIDAAKPQLSWRIQSDERGAKQSAYQILVASSAEKLNCGEGDLWDSGRVATDQSVRMPYAGKSLRLAGGLLLEGAGLGWKEPAERVECSGKVEHVPKMLQRRDMVKAERIRLLLVFRQHAGRNIHSKQA